MNSKQELFSYLNTGSSITASQISLFFGLKNPHGAIHQLRGEGHCIYSNKTSQGTVKYRIGKPSKRMVRVVHAGLGTYLFTA